MRKEERETATHNFLSNRMQAPFQRTEYAGIVAAPSSLEELSTIPAHVMASRVYRTFALVGIRRKIVVESGGGNRLAGIITRGDLLEAQEGRLPRRTARGGGVSNRGADGGRVGRGSHGGGYDHDHGGLRDGGWESTLRLSWGGEGSPAPHASRSRASRSLQVPATITGPSL